MATKRTLHGRTPEPEVMSDELEAESYDEADFRRVNSAFVRRLGREVTKKRGRALDLGTGPGEIPLRFVESFPGWRVTAVDLSESMLERADQAKRTHRHGDRVEFVRADAKSLATSTRYDLVFSNSLLHHLPNPDDLWAALPGYVMRGGQVVVMDLRRP
ncbi:MAG: class I SAM-dependent methyltransferase, partial [Planctomycetota bacterium]